MAIHTVLFDLDGTLIDSVQDFLAVINPIRQQQGNPSIDANQLRPAVARGGVAIVSEGLALAPDHPQFRHYHQQFLTAYGQHTQQHPPSFFPGIPEVLHWLLQQTIPWGIITNKHTAFVHNVVQQSTLLQQACCVICGDTTSHSKPHPAPLLHACHHHGITPAECIYIGDTQIDVQAGQRAGMQTAAVLYGYQQPQHPNEWRADVTLPSPQQLLSWLQHHASASH